LYVCQSHFRSKKKTHKLNDYDSQSPAIDTADGTEKVAVSATHTGSGVMSVLTGGLGDMTASLEALKAAAPSMRSSTNVPDTQTTAQRKQRPDTGASFTHTHTHTHTHTFHIITGRRRPS
jgi:hypothetical protein